MATNTPQPPPPSNEVYAVFCGTVEQATTQRIFQAVAGAMANQVTRLHLLFQSTGGMVADGICLYNFLRTCPLPVTLYNCGTIASIGVIAYLGAQERQTSASATFMVHRTTASPQFATTAILEAVTKGIALDDQRTEAILRNHVKLTDEQWLKLDRADQFFSASEAVAIGLATRIGEFSPPRGMQVFNI